MLKYLRALKLMTVTRAGTRKCEILLLFHTKIPGNMEEESSSLSEVIESFLPHTPSLVT